ncbi:MAG: hypothetical protein LBN95_12750 [Prevotellaceae bacterium]|jgi:hypothetical protein|nr:hypothetical protein [Prevotellaceae bacterium]
MSAISSLFNELKSFVKNDFNIAAYLYTFVFICVIIFLNYHFGFYSKVINPTFFTGKSQIAFFLLYSFVYFAAAIPTLCLRKEFAVLKQSKFYFKALFFIALYSISIGFFSYSKWRMPYFTQDEQFFLLRLFSNLKGCFLIMLPLAVFKIFFDKKINGIYGLANNAKHLKIYLLAVGVMLPFLIATSFTPDFLSAYPQFKPWFYDEVFGMKAAVFTPIFEVFYAIDFINTELFFRGARVIGMTASLGPRAVLPMVAFYVAIHFGKPIGETISSMFGGYILGILAYQTKHIWGGVTAHIGVALTMEIMGFLHYYVIK